MHTFRSKYWYADTIPQRHITSTLVGKADIEILLHE